MYVGSKAICDWLKQLFSHCESTRRKPTYLTIDLHVKVIVFGDSDRKLVACITDDPSLDVERALEGPPGWRETWEVLLGFSSWPCVFQKFPLLKNCLSKLTSYSIKEDASGAKLYIEYLSDPTKTRPHPVGLSDRSQGQASDTTEHLAKAPRLSDSGRTAPASTSEPGCASGYHTHPVIIDLSAGSKGQATDTIEHLAKVPRLSDSGRTASASTSESCVPGCTSTSHLSAAWEYKSFLDSWKPFSEEDSVAVDRLWSQWNESSNPQDGGSSIQVCIGERLYEINFQTMTQTNLRTNTSRELRRRLLDKPASHDISHARSSQNVPSCSSSSSQKLPSLEARLARLERELKEEKSRSEQELKQEKARSEAAARQVLSEAADLMEARFRAERAVRALEVATKRIEEHSEQTVSLHAELEVWKNQTIGHARLHPRPHLREAAQRALRSVTTGHYGKCEKIKHAVVIDVQGVANTSLWNKYVLNRKTIFDSLQSRRECPWAKNIAPGIEDLIGFFPHLQLVQGANEVLLLHGTSNEIASRIVLEGFDDRLNTRNMYGNGIYFTTEPCKASQYCTGDIGCIIVTRVVLGHPFMASSPMPTHKRPPMVEGRDVPHDSTIAQPGIPHHAHRNSKKQTHWEFVVQREQVYPELVVHFKYE